MKMKSTGMVRHLDELGRIVLPMELRRTLGINKRDPLEIFVDKDMIILRKYQPSCIFCGNDTGVITFKENLICSDCVTSITNK